MADHLNFESVAVDLEARATRLSTENNPNSMGVDEVVYSVAQFVRAMGKADKVASTIARRLLVLTVVLVLLGVALISVAVFDIVD